MEKLIRTELALASEGHWWKCALSLAVVPTQLARHDRRIARTRRICGPARSRNTTKGKDLAETCFHSIDGFTESELYAVGWDGEIWHYNGTEWFQLVSPTNLALYKVICALDGNVYACGQLGILLRGRHNKWAVLDQELTKEDLWGLAWFNDQLFASSSHFVYKLMGDTLRRADMGPIKPPSTCHQLSAADGLLWSIGAKDVMQFDGQTWSRIV